MLYYYYLKVATVCVSILSTMLFRYPVKIACKSTSFGLAVLKYYILPCGATVLNIMKVNVKLLSRRL